MSDHDHDWCPKMFSNSDPKIQTCSTCPATRTLETYVGEDGYLRVRIVDQQGVA